MTYYGRWTYKFEEAARRGAAGILIVHETRPAGYPFQVVQGNLREKFDLVTPDKNMGRAAIEGWVTLDTAKAILKMAGQDLDALKSRRSPVSSSRARSTLTAIGWVCENTMRNARLEKSSQGRRQRSRLRDEYFISLGALGSPASGTGEGDRIYNGALDNARVAQLLKSRRPSQPSSPSEALDPVLMGDGGREGLLGCAVLSSSRCIRWRRPSQHQVDGTTSGKHKGHHRGRHGRPDLDDYLPRRRHRPAACCVRSESEKGFYYRSDHFNFAAGRPGSLPHVGANSSTSSGLQQKKREVRHSRLSPALGRGETGLGSERGRGRRAADFPGGLPGRQRRQDARMEAGNEFRATREKMLNANP